MLNDLWRNGFTAPANKTRWQLFRYLLAGGTAASVDWFLYWLLISALGMHYLISATISFILATTVNYFLSAFWVFRNKRRYGRAKEFFLLFMVSLIGLLINQFFLVIFIEFIMLHFMLAKVIATAMVFFWNFFLRKHVVF